MKNYNAKFKTFHFGLLFFILTFLFFNALPIFVQNSAAEEYNFKESSGLNKTADKTSGAGYDTSQTFSLVSFFFY
ncbi:hypothetical protein HY798_02710 [Candidatus Falkowbacteria bacterium]|nr:hypothetical protein [Candidatus Falkowbacteria bacterium]